MAPEATSARKKTSARWPPPTAPFSFSAKARKMVANGSARPSFRPPSTSPSAESVGASTAASSAASQSSASGSRASTQPATIVNGSPSPSSRVVSGASVVHRAPLTAMASVNSTMTRVSSRKAAATWPWPEGLIRPVPWSLASRPTAVKMIAPLIGVGRRRRSTTA